MNLFLRIGVLDTTIIFIYINILSYEKMYFRYVSIIDYLLLLPEILI
ncbi:hypothetical protein B0O79_0679 [Flavobacteriaceae bacterium MAR_2009_75]|nr:hypothetical protein B0O79_0679 [Flavobacteriaceae bacterium MAR_2009_75]